MSGLGSPLQILRTLIVESLLLRTFFGEFVYYAILERIVYGKTMAIMSVRSYLGYILLQFELLTATYMLEPWEKKLFNSIVVTLFAMSTYTTYVYLPRYTKSVLAYFGYLD